MPGFCVFTAILLLDMYLHIQFDVVGVFLGCIFFLLKFLPILDFLYELIGLRSLNGIKGPGHAKITRFAALSVWDTI